MRASTLRVMSFFDAAPAPATATPTVPTPTDALPTMLRASMRPFEVAATVKPPACSMVLAS
ncbi:MAG TPA: hypothetical protein VK570_17940, partial [Rubrivivax sp.]|nr:hypothetical protein [Rubrivivax sp.]